MKEGKVASFSCRVIGEPTPELTWQLNGEPVMIEGRYTVIERDGLQVLQVHNVVPGDTGEYKVVARNCAGEASCSANMTVEGKNLCFTMTKTTPTFGFPFDCIFYVVMPVLTIITYLF